MNAEQGQGYEETDVSDTLNVFDNSEARTPTLIKQSIGGGVRPTNLKGEEILPTLVAGIYKQVGTTQDGLSVVVSSPDKVQKPKE